MKMHKMQKKIVLVGIFVILTTAGLVQGISEQYTQYGGGGTREENENITYVGSCETSYRAVELDIQNDYAYVATHIYQHTCPPYAGALDVVDITTNPQEPDVIGSCDEFEQLLNVVVYGDYAYVIMKEDQNFYLKEVNIANPTHPVLYDFLSVDLGDIMNTYIIDLYVQNDLLYVFTPGALMFYSLENLGYLNSLPLDGLTCVDDFYVDATYAYLLGNNQGYIRAKEYMKIVNIADIWDPVLLVTREMGSPGCVNHIAINQVEDTVYAYCAAENGVWIMDVTDPANPSSPISYVLPHWQSYIRSDGAFLYLSGGAYGITVLDIANPVAPVKVGFYDSPGNASAIDIAGNYIYVADDESGFLILQFMNVEGPSTPAKPFGPTQGEPDVTYRFYVQVPPEARNDSLYLMWDWGDGATSGWLGPYGPYYPLLPPIVSTKHSWEQGGVFSIRVKAKNSADIESGWSEPHVITIINDPPAAPNTPSGPTEGYRYKEYKFSTSTTDPNGDELYYQWRFGPLSTEWFGPYKPGEIVTIVHTWDTIVNCDITVRAKDGHDAIGDWSLPLSIQILNQAPDIPDTPTGPTSGTIGTTYTYSTKTNDVDNDQVYYQWDWGDGTQSGWLGPFDAGVIATADHSWDDAGDYAIKVKAKDTIGDESSGWSQSLIVQISAPELALSLKGGLGLTLTIENSGDAEANDVEYSITFDGKFIFLPKDGTVQGVIYDNIPPGETVPVDVFILGFGRTTITATAEIPDVTTATIEATAFVLGPFVLVRSGSNGLIFYIVEPNAVNGK